MTAHVANWLVSALEVASHTIRSRVFEAGTSAYAGRCSVRSLEDCNRSGLAKC